VSPPLRKEINQLKRVLVDKTLELDFFKGALQKVEARRRKSGITGEKASTTKSRSDAIARQLKHRANVSAGRSQPSRFLSFSAGPSTGRGRHGGAQRDSADCCRASTPIRVIDGSAPSVRRRGMLVNHKRVLRIIRKTICWPCKARAFVVITDSDHDLEVF